MNRADIRQAVFDQIDWQPDTSEQLEAKLNRFINRAYLQLALEAPYLFFEDKVSFRSQVTITSADSITNDRVTQSTNVETDGIVWKRTYTVSADRTPAGDDANIVQWDPEIAAHSAEALQLGHPFEGRTIEITDSTGRVHRRKIRSIRWKEISLTHTDYIVLDQPLDLRTDSSASSEYSSLKYRIVTPSYYLPADLIEVRSIRLWDEAHRDPVNLIYTEEAEEQWWDDIQGSNSSGSPRKAFRTDFFQLPAPTYKPIVETEDGTWDTTFGQPQLAGYEFFYTICWGSLDPLDGIAAGAEGTPTYHRRPKFESAPSPISEKIRISSTSKVVKITTPDLGAAYGFTPSTTSYDEYYRSGYWKRFYVRRTDSTADTVGSTNQDTEGFYYFDRDPGHDGQKYYKGNLINLSEPYTETHGYSGIQLSPLPDAAYTVDVRCLRKPKPLLEDQAVPKIPPEAIGILIHKILVLVYESLGAYELSQASRAVYLQQLTTVSNRYGSLPTGVFRKRLARAGGHGRRGYRFLVDKTGES
tara:strand:+ start:564 stop:2147 length:1584 start_codon:yes stop_codon:yes gene_type:complete